MKPETGLVLHHQFTPKPFIERFWRRLRIKLIVWVVILVIVFVSSRLFIPVFLFYAVMFLFYAWADAKLETYFIRELKLYKSGHIELTYEFYNQICTLSGIPNITKRYEFRGAIPVLIIAVEGEKVFQYANRDWTPYRIDEVLLDFRENCVETSR